MIFLILMCICGQELVDRFDYISFGMFLWVFVDEFFDVVNIGEDDFYKVFFMDEEECNFSLDVVYFEIEIQVFFYIQQVLLIILLIFFKDSNGLKVLGVVCIEDRFGFKGMNVGWVK